MKVTNHSVHYQKLQQWIDPEQAFISLFADAASAFWLDSSLPDKEFSRFSYMGIPEKIITYSLGTNTVTVEKNKKKKQISRDIFSYLETQLSQSKANANLPFDFIGGYVGYFGYELKSLCGAKKVYASSYPDSLWYYVGKFLVFDNKEKEIYLVSITNKKIDKEKWFDEIKKSLSSMQTSSVLPSAHNERKESKLQFKLARNHDQYLKDIAACKEYLRNGESYEICLTNSLSAEADIAPLIVYRALRSINPAPYAAYIKYNDLAILCSSPEKFIAIDQDRWIESKPIKGTIKRGKNPEEDKKLAAELAASEKDRAENLMIVDLVRNDLGKISEIGTVSVSKLMAIESYKTVHQLVSTIHGKLQKGISVIEGIKACFPGGSMTGAPKIRTMEIIDRLEKNPRGIYSGALGFLSFNNTAALNIVIRTIIMQENNLAIGAGGAIVMQSDPEKEYEEMMLKAKALLQAVSLVYNAPLHKVYMALGSNVGDKKQNIKKAVNSLKTKIKDIEIAKIYETKPMYFEAQDNFFNTVLSGSTELSPIELLAFAKNIERTAGRIKRFPNGPREIDIDILFYDDLIFKNKDLQIPHPHIQERDFVMRPFMDIAPNFKHPVFGKTIKKLFNSKNSLSFK